MKLPSLLPRLLTSVALAACFVGLSACRTVQSAGSGPEATARAAEMMAGARVAAAANDDFRALGRYETVIQVYGETEHAAEAHYRSGLIRMENRRWTKAFDHFQAIVDSYPDYPGFREVIRRQYEIAEALGEGARIPIGPLPGFSSPSQAVEYFEQIVANAPYSDVAPLALLKAADLEAKRDNLDEAIDLYDRFISTYSDHEKAADAYFGLAEAFSVRVRGPAYDQGANREAIGYYEDFVLLHPRHSRVAEAEERIRELRDILAQSRVVIGDFYFFYRDNLTAARVFYNEAISLSPNSPSAGEAREKLLRVAEREKADAG